MSSVAELGFHLATMLAVVFLFSSYFGVDPSRHLPDHGEPVRQCAAGGRRGLREAVAGPTRQLYQWPGDDNDGRERERERERERGREGGILDLALQSRRRQSRILALFGVRVFVVLLCCLFVYFLFSLFGTLVVCMLSALRVRPRPRTRARTSLCIASYRRAGGQAGVRVLACLFVVFACWRACTHAACLLLLH